MTTILGIPPKNFTSNVSAVISENENKKNTGKGFSLSQALDMLEEDDDLLQNVDEISLKLPDPNVDTDEDSADEEEGGMMCNLNGRQLLAPAEIKLVNNDRIGASSRCDEPENNAPERQVTETIPLEMDENVLFDPESEWITYQPDYSRCKDMSPVELFELFFDENIYQYLAEQTQRYAYFKNEPDPEITSQEIRCFTAILILTGSNPFTFETVVLGYEDDTHNKMVADSMRRDRFLKIQWFIHMADNTKMDQSDKAWKLHPLMNALKEKFLSNFQPTQNLPYDESMIKYYGRHGCKQFIRGKPIHVGYKVWSLNSKDGYLVDFDLYQGNDPRERADISKLVGKCAAPMILMLKELSQRNLSYVIHIDNLFTGLNLLAYLRYLGYGAIDMSDDQKTRISKKEAWLL
ncbi:hypothetical protein NQ314_010380 [Rhamnusium bicolor]|uniref:PiggyBac transposable element-derived protein domain-containing protein n=1 Tax=Rhamnusium bicolor TaxID=1586634 RepID=A0AAV8XR57_9CUCU|nr:hypothetical protein NQ314_010380 [Rhamnusium bicolor]